MGRRRRNKNKVSYAHLSRKSLLAKAEVIIGNEISEAAAIKQIQSRENIFEDQGAVLAEYEPQALLNFIEITPHLSPSIASYAHNIEGYGYQYDYIEPWMADMDSEEAEQAVRQALVIEQWVQNEESALAVDAEKSDIIYEIGKCKRALKDAIENKRTKTTIKKWEKAITEQEERLDELTEPEAQDDEDRGNDDNEITDEIVKAKIEEIKLQIRSEQYKFNSFFENCCSDMSFTALRRIVREDYESHGWGTYEKERDGYGRLKRVSYVPAYTVRPIAKQGELVDAIEDDPVTPLSQNREIVVKRRFNIYVQIVQDKKVYFKSPGDPRVISRKTGNAYKDERELKKVEGKDVLPANEIVWQAQHSPKSPCPAPRWIGNLLQVLGGREADETNYYYLRDNAIPYGLLFCSGGFIPTDIKERLESRLSAEMAGSEGAGKILVVQATPMGKASADGRTVLPEMEFQSLRQAHEQDALFTKYDERGSDRIGASFRLPPLLRGYTPSTLNRATAIASIMFAEQQVFQPERQDSDWVINKYILKDLGIRFLKFVSNSPTTRSVDDIVNIIKAAAPQGGLLPYEIRQLIAEMLNKPVTKVKEDWAQKPMAMTLAGIQGDGEMEPLIPSQDDEENQNLNDLARQMGKVEARIRDIVAEEFAAFGMDVDVGAALIPDKTENDDDDAA